MSEENPVSPEARYPEWLASGDVRVRVWSDGENVKMIVNVNGETFGRMIAVNALAEPCVLGDAVFKSTDGCDPTAMSVEDYRAAEQAPA